MFRTRDFVLFLVVIVFLLIGIGSTIVLQKEKRGFAPANSVSENTTEEYSVEVYTKPTISREERIESMRQKVALSKELTISETLSEEAEETSEVDFQSSESETESTSTPPTSETILVNEVLKCPFYQEYSENWPRFGGAVEIEVTEGARLVYQEIVSENETGSLTATSASVLPSDIKRSILMQLPIRMQPNAVPSCLQSDVVGVAKDGSLIRNSEITLYGIFGAETLVGYALDGFPIYGKNTVQTDTCGGVMVSGQYRYYISEERDTIINCFSAPPATL